MVLDCCRPSGTFFGRFPLLPSEQTRHIKGVLTRQGVGQEGDDQVQEYLSYSKAKLPDRCLRIPDDDEWESDDDSTPPLTQQEIEDKTKKYVDSVCMGGCW